MRATVVSLILLLVLPVYAEPGEAEMTAGMDFFYQERWNDAIAHFRQALLDDPNNSLALSYILHAYYKQSDLDSIFKEIERKAEGDDATATAHLGFAYLMKGLTDPQVTERALGRFNLAIERDPKLAIGHCGLGVMYFLKHRPIQSKDHTVKALRINPNDIMALDLLGNIMLVDEKKSEDALPLFQKITVLLPSYPDGHYHKGSALFELGRYEEAVEPLESAVELDPRGVTKGLEASLLLRQVYLKLGRTEKARALPERRGGPRKHWDWVEPPKGRFLKRSEADTL